MRIYLVKFLHLCRSMSFRLFDCSSYLRRELLTVEVYQAWGVRNRESVARGEILRKRNMLNEKSIK